MRIKQASVEKAWDYGRRRPGSTRSISEQVHKTFLKDVMEHALSQREERPMGMASLLSILPERRGLNGAGVVPKKRVT